MEIIRYNVLIRKDESFIQHKEFMCKQKRPGIKDFFTNLKAPMPLGRKMSLLFRNNVIKIINRQNCCGHPDEPGC